MHCLEARFEEIPEMQAFEESIHDTKRSRVISRSNAMVSLTTMVTQRLLQDLDCAVLTIIRPPEACIDWVSPFAKPNPTDAFYASFMAFKAGHELSVAELSVLFGVSRQGVYDWIKRGPATILHKHQRKMSLLVALFSNEESYSFPLKQWLSDRDDPATAELISLLAADDPDEAALWKWLSRVSYRTQRLAKLAAMESAVENAPKHWLVDPSNSGV